MNIENTVKDQMTEAMKTGDQFKLAVLRMLKSALTNASIAKESHQLTEIEEIEVVQKEIKKRKASAEMYKTGNRPELADKEEKEVEILETFLPAQMSDAEIETEVKTAIAQTGAATIQDTGKVMGMVMAKLRGKADGGKISELVRRQLGS